LEGSHVRHTNSITAEFRSILRKGRIPDGLVNASTNFHRESQTLISRDPQFIAGLRLILFGAINEQSSTEVHLNCGRYVRPNTKQRNRPFEIAKALSRAIQENGISTGIGAQQTRSLTRSVLAAASNEPGEIASFIATHQAANIASVPGELRT